MGILSDFEDRLARTVEGAFAGAFRSPVQPAELARALSRAMDDGRVVGVGKVYAPTEYMVELSQDDAYKLQSFEGVLSKELATYLEDHARKRDYTLACAPTVEFDTSPILKLGRFKISAQLASPPDEDARAAVIEAETAEPVASTPTSDAGPRIVGEPGPVIGAAASQPVVAPVDPVSDAPVFAVPAAAPEPLVPEQPPAPLISAASQPVVPFAMAAAVTPAIPATSAPSPGSGLATVTIGDDAHDVALTSDRMEIGRLADCALRISDVNASRRHAAIIAIPNGWAVEDLDSTNGTMLNGQPVVSPTPLKDGDVISVGITRLVFHAGTR